MDATTDLLGIKRFSIEFMTDRRRATDRAHRDSESAFASSVRRYQPLRSLLRLLHPHRKKMAFAVVAFVIKDSPVWVLPPVTAAIIDIVVAGGPAWRIAAWGAVALSVLALNYPFTMIFVRLSSSSTRTLAYAVRTGLASRLQRLSLGFHNRQSASLVQTKIVRDVESLELMLAQVLPTVVSACATVVGAIVITAISVPPFVAVFLLAIPVAAALVAFIRRRASARNEAFRSEVERLSAQVSEMAALMPITRGHGLEDVATERVARHADSVRQVGRDLDLLNGRFSALSWLAYQVLGLLCLVSAALLAVSQIFPISAGQVVLLSTYFGLLTSSIVMLLNVTPIFARGLDAVRSLSDVAEELDVEDDEGKLPVDRVDGCVEFKDVVVRYSPAETPALDGINLRIAPGETVAFVGASGSGKSTLLNAALGFVNPESGSVLIDGRDMQSLNRRSFRSHISIVPQEVALLAGTVRDNVAYGTPHLSDEDIFTALEEADALDILHSGGGGLETIVGERGSSLSGGQRQRLAIARALVRRPRILVLDEATSALDAISESRVTAALDRARHGRTTLIVAHRMSTIRRADTIVVLQSGRLAEVGNHDSLIAREGLYARLATSV